MESAKGKEQSCRDLAGGFMVGGEILPTDYKFVIGGSLT
jgi:hypothetical protein